jgi:hypothetical protein
MVTLRDTASLHETNYPVDSLGKVYDFPISTALLHGIPY